MGSSPVAQQPANGYIHENHLYRSAVAGDLINSSPARPDSFGVKPIQHSKRKTITGSLTSPRNDLTLFVPVHSPSYVT